MLKVTLLVEIDDKWLVVFINKDYDLLPGQLMGKKDDIVESLGEIGLYMVNSEFFLPLIEKIIK